MRILVVPLVFPSAAQPTPGIFVLRQMQALRELGHEFEVLRIVPFAPRLGRKWSAYADVPDREVVDGFQVRTIRALIPPRRIALEYVPVQVFAAVERAISRFRADAVHAHFLIPSGDVAVGHRVPSIVTAHGGDAYSWPFQRSGLLRAARRAIVRATQLAAVSEFISERLWSIGERRAAVVWNGGDERVFYPRERDACRLQWSVPVDRCVIAFAGTLQREKGLFDLIEAIERLRDVRPIVLAAGAGPEGSAIAEAARNAGVEFRLLGTLDSQALSTVFGAANIVVLPSHNEGLPAVVCEAMLCERVVVATTVGGIPEIVDQGRSGLLVPPRDVVALSEALRLAATDGGRRDDLARAGRAFAAEHLTWRANARRYDELYHAAVGDRFETSRRRPVTGGC
jgi:teichuronic acid biosynthesis glycosyltransferase TuaC